MRAVNRRLPRAHRSALLSVVLAVFGAVPASAAVSLRPVPVTLDQPLFLTHAGDARLFVVERAGRVLVLDSALTPSAPRVFLDIRSQVSVNVERGLFSMAFHPDYATNGLFYINYTNLAGDTVIARYRVSADPNRADAGSATTLLLIDQPAANHNGGQLQIGPRDGHLYIGMGDGGGFGDAPCNAQTTTGGQLLGKMLRLDIRQNIATPPFYGIPSDNPFRAALDPQGTVADEVWAVGLRNPWRFSFDRLTGDLFIGDVGQDRREEVDFEAAGSPGGRNYGWKVMEGTSCFSASGCPAGTPSCNDPALIRPIFEYPHPEGCSVTGGYVSRGARAPELRGAYVFGDYCSGDVWTLRRNTNGVWQRTEVANVGSGLASFGEGVNGELYLMVGDELMELMSDAAPLAVPLARGTTGHLGLGLGALGLLTAAWSAQRLNARYWRRPNPLPKR
jgi:glucose/arabinose dehydrogenase